MSRPFACPPPLPSGRPTERPTERPAGGRRGPVAAPAGSPIRSCASALIAAGVIGCSAEDKLQRGTLSGQHGTSLRVVALIDEAPTAAPFSLFAAGVTRFDAGQPAVLQAETGATVEIGPGELRVFIGDVSDPADLSDGLPLWTDPSGTQWISPSTTIVVHDNTHHEVTFTLNQRATGAWRCESAGMRARTDALFYAEGARTTLPGPGPVRVEGRRITVEDSIHTIEGSFSDAAHAELRETPLGRPPRDWRCCAEAVCATDGPVDSGTVDSGAPPAP